MTAFVPTVAERPMSAKTPGAAVFLNLADSLKGANPDTVRHVTWALAELRDKDPFATIDGIETSEWVRKTLFAPIDALPKTSAIERLRCGGLLASWDRPTRALPFLRSAVDLLKVLAVKTEGPPIYYQDNFIFCQMLDLTSGVDPDELFAVLWGTRLQCLLVGPHMRTKPSLENQRKLLRMLDDPDPEIRVQVYSRLASWYADWDHFRISVASWSKEAGALQIAGEAELRTYWEQKLGVAAKP